jgi:hypothetical protein
MISRSSTVAVIAGSVAGACSGSLGSAMFQWLSNSSARCATAGPLTPTLTSGSVPSRRLASRLLDDVLGPSK